uniref:protein KTI12 homolog n=1 Tax=Styela clava TaxID=7725 RepID=UPI001939BCE5|nr:protein KTI12 homolog [Styela clava]
MPLVIICGFPSSGKSTRAQELVSYLQENFPVREVISIGDKELSIDKNIVYSDSKNEKSVRGSLKSEVDRNLTKENVVILDSLNYIKGFRYELFCITKYARTPQCVIHTDISPEGAKEWNKNRAEEERYSDDIIDALIMRFEPPDSRNRWDSPLFTIQVGDTLPGKEICDALFHQKTPKPNMSTQNPPLRETDFLYEVSKQTQDMISTILTSQKTMIIGDYVTMPGTTDKYIITQNLTLSQLRRIRQQFLTYVKSGTTAKIEDIPKTFLLFLNKCVETC